MRFCAIKNDTHLLNGAHAGFVQINDHSMNDQPSHGIPPLGCQPFTDWALAWAHHRLETRLQVHPRLDSAGNNSPRNLDLFLSAYQSNEGTIVRTYPCSESFSLCRIKRIGEGLAGDFFAMKSLHRLIFHDLNNSHFFNLNSRLDQVNVIDHCRS
ncbi:hypothetical protein [Pandoraea sp. NPDC090278]|uniref:hypothetical protein n=1 Tax=Pandoraea sp. NPDC090278 TaxID=3364391 RepID=UPI00383B4531